MLGVNAFVEIFVPGSRHTHDERKRLELTRDEEGNSNPARGPIDLDSGTVVINLAAPRDEAADPDSGA
ncbi:DUF6191 domain-containing protein [Streptomyces oceani]|uniref:Uncharacterized protein n=1 Tax=Streptomyces oceani TaxID=1075402 RepID=A0A1E7KLM7_9ACTN|nr:DUF6191 domain-containing protein [Streptomyces oceani]OEV04787.1 hypothetical protein AN216_05810 [Streptomyces oceani]